MTQLKYKTASGVKWSAISQAGRQGIQILTIILLARLLPPSDFGILGMAMVIIGLIDIFKDLGTGAAVIQKKDISEVFLSSIFWINVAFGILAMVVLLFAAPLGGLFYREPRVIDVLRVLSLNFFISGLSILQQALLERSLDFQTLAKVEIGAVISGAIIGVIMALTRAGVWSLVFQSLTTVSVTTLLLWLYSSWRPRRIFRWEEIKSVVGFSLNLVGFNMFNYFSRNADYLLIGRYLGAQDLGYYTLAYRILLFPVQSISNVIQRVVFPVYSSIQDDNARFSSIYLRVAACIALITFPMMMGVIALARPFVIVIFGMQWQPVIVLIMILAPVGLTQSIGSLVGTIYQAKGRTDWMFRWGIGSGVLVLIAFIIGLQWGIMGVAVAYAIATFGLTYFSHAIPFRFIDLRFVNLVQAVHKPFVNSLIMLVTIVLFRYSLTDRLSNGFSLGLSILIGLVTYTVMNWLTNREQLEEVWELVMHRRLVA